MVNSTVAYQNISNAMITQSTMFQFSLSADILQMLLSSKINTHISSNWFYKRLLTLFQHAKLRPTGVRVHSLRTNYDIFVCPTPDLKYDRMFG